MDTVYYEASRPGSYGGARALARHSAATIKTAKQWLESQDAYTLHKPVLKKFPRRKTFSKSPGDMMQADLAVMTHLNPYNDGYSYILTCIDVFTRYAWGIPLKDKRATSVAAAFEKIFEERVPNLLQTDDGMEFWAKGVQGVFRKYDIQHYSSENLDVKASLAERLIRTLKGKIYRYMTHHRTNRWIDVLPSVVESYNRSYHRSIGMAPVEVNAENRDEVTKRLYPPKPPLRYKYNVGDRVRISRYKHIFQKGYLPNYSVELFEIADKYPTYPVTYGLKDLAGETIKGKFYEPEIQKVTTSSDDLYDVEKVLKTRRRHGKVEYFVKWKGYPDKFNSWVTDIVRRT